MNSINFEGLGLYFKVNKVAFSIFGIEVRWYAVFIVIGIIIAILLCKKDHGKYGIKFEDVIELLIFALPISIICARLYFISFKFEYYMKNPQEILNIRNGGLAIYGGIIGAVITIFVFCKIKKIKVLDMLDYMAPYLPLGQAIGRWGNFFNGEAHGMQTTNIFRMGIMENGRYIEVHPTFFYESICTFLIFIFLYIKRNKRDYRGQITFTYFFLYGIARTFIEGIRTDSLMMGNIRISQLLSILLCIVFGIILLFKEKNKNYIIGIFIILADQISKIFFTNANIVIIPGILKFSYTQNTGAAFSIGTINVVMILSLVITIVFIFLAKKHNSKYKLPYTLIIAGSIGNLIDRFFRGYVVDFISILKFPIFNIADISITIGIVFLVFKILKKVKI